MDDVTAPRRWTLEHPDGPRYDVDGVAWYACDGWYPRWYRWENGELITSLEPVWPALTTPAITG